MLQFHDVEGMAIFWVSIKFRIWSQREILYIWKFFLKSDSVDYFVIHSNLFCDIFLDHRQLLSFSACWSTSLYKLSILVFSFSITNYLNWTIFFKNKNLSKEKNIRYHIFLFKSVWSNLEMNSAQHLPTNYSWSSMLRWKWIKIVKIYVALWHLR